MFKRRDVRIPRDAPPMATQAEVARWFGVRRWAVTYWRDHGHLGPWVRQGRQTVLFHTSAVRRFAAELLGVPVEAQAGAEAPEPDAAATIT